MKKEKCKSIELQEARDLIIRAAPVLDGVEIGLAESLSRFPASDLLAGEDLPGYDQSLRDGYAIAEPGKDPAFVIVDEVAAGDTRKLSLEPGQAVRIMTGGLVPARTDRVIPEEQCRVFGSNVCPVEGASASGKRFIHGRGSELARGTVIVAKGREIRAEQQILLAGVGYESVAVVRRPRVSFFCTGSELLSGSGQSRAGKKFSANSHLLHGLIALNGAEVANEQTVKDVPEEVDQILKAMQQSGADIIISTGGMGPGKFDLVEAAFQRAGGRVLYDSLNMRPGKSTLFGTLGSVLFFGMPGPPPAVHLLFNELIRTAILALQGAASCSPQELNAILTEDMAQFGSGGLPRLKSGLLSFDGGRCLVRAAARMEAANCYIYCPGNGQSLTSGTLVRVHMTGSTQGCF